MPYYLLLAAVSFAAFAVAATVIGVLVAALRPPLRTGGLSSRARAARLLAWRVAPSLAGLVMTLLLAAAFVRYEPAATGERPGWTLTAAALAGVLLWISACVRAAGDAVRSRRIANLARRCPAAPGLDSPDVVVVDASYPVAAVCGWRRPRVLLSSRILAECTREEIDLIVAHERAHVRGRDNALRALLRCLPDPLGMTRAGVDIERAWTLAVEEAADDGAAGDDPVRRATLASALVRVAGLAAAPPPRWMPALAFYQGEHLARRVSSLLVSRKETAGSRRSLLALPAALAAVLCAGLSSARMVHEITEWIVHSLP